MDKTLEEFYFGNDDFGKEQDNICTKLNEINAEQILGYISDNKEKIKFISAANIPQFSNYNLVESVLQIIMEAKEDNIDYEYIGEKLKVSNSKTAKVKYGENHLKLVIQMGLVLKNPYRVSSLGRSYLFMGNSEKEELKRKLYLKVPIIQKIIATGIRGEINAMSVIESYLSAKTAERRRGNVRKLFVEILKDLPEEKRNLLINNISWGIKR